jgi:O-antigen ligase
VKFVILIMALSAVVPVSGWLRANPQHALKFWIVLGFLPFGITAIPHSNIAIISWSDWPGFVKGAELNALDLIAFTIYLSLPPARRSVPFKISMALYFASVLFSAIQASVPFAALLYAWQLARVFFIFAVVARGCLDNRIVVAVLTGMAIGLGVEASVVVVQRLGFGELQASGTLVHQNSLGLASHFVVFPLFALLLAGRPGWQPFLAPLAGSIISIFTGSRATIGLAALGYGTVFVLSALRGWTIRKAMVAVAGIAVMGALAPLAISTLETRFSGATDYPEYDERAAFEVAASKILSDFPMGIGANNYVVVANTQGYLSSSGVAAVAENRSAHVHNAYLLAFAETGYAGGLAFAFMLCQPLIAAFVVGWRHRGDPRSDVLLGLGVSLLVVYLHNFFEFIFLVYYIQYMCAISMGLIAGLAQQLRYPRQEDNFQSGSLKF